MNDDSEIRIVIGGDIVPIGKGIEAFESGAVDLLVENELLGIISSADFSVFNLETPLTDSMSPIPKCGPNLAAPTRTTNGLAAINRGAFALANNHILDHGEQGLLSTMRALADANVAYFGAGLSIGEALRAFVYEREGVSIGFYACAEHEFSTASEFSPGANPFDPLESLDHIAELKNRCDYVCVLYHGGKEHYRYPSPQLRKRCRKIAEKGADLIVCQHSHCIGCKEEWRGSTIVYGQGNFLFDHSDSDYWKTGLLISSRISKESLRIDFIPIQKDGIAVKLSRGKDRDSILDGFEKRSREIQSPGFVETKYSEYSKTMLDGYLSSFIPGGKSIAFRALNKLCGHRIALLLGSKTRFLANRNFIECEAHRELFLAGLNNRIDK